MSDLGNVLHRILENENNEGYLIFLLDIRIRSPKHRRNEPPQGCAVHTAKISIILVMKRKGMKITC